jgi:hypothetical protein
VSRGEDLYKKSAEVYHIHSVCNRLEKKAFERKILFTFKYRHQRAQQCHNKSFIITRLFSPHESFDSGLPGIRRNIDGQRRTVCYKPRNLTHRGITRKPECLLDLYSRELISTIDRYKKWKKCLHILKTTTAAEPRYYIERFASAWLLTILQLQSLNSHATYGRRDRSSDSLFGESTCL